MYKVVNKNYGGYITFCNASTKKNMAYHHFYIYMLLYVLTLIYANVL